MALHRELANEQGEQDHQDSSPDSRRDGDVIKAGRQTKSVVGRTG